MGYYAALMALVPRILILVSMLASAFPGQVSAQRGDVALARQLFRQGIELSDAEQWAEAADHFQRSIELRPSSIAAYNLGSVLVELGRLVEGAEAFRLAIRTPRVRRRVRRAAQDSLAEVEPRIGRLTIELEGDRTGVEIQLDGRPVLSQAIGVAAPADPGSRRIVALRDGEEIATAEVEITEGGSAVTRLELPAPVVIAPVENPDPEPDILTPAPGPMEPPPEGGFLASPWFWTGAGVAVVASVIVIVVVASPSDAAPLAPIPGNLRPGIIEF